MTSPSTWANTSGSYPRARLQSSEEIEGYCSLALRRFSSHTALRSLLTEVALHLVRAVIDELVQRASIGMLVHVEFPYSAILKDSYVDLHAYAVFTWFHGCYSL